MIALSLYLPEFPTDLTRRRSKLDARLPIILARDEHQREIVAACCARAARAGVQAGMTVSQAKAILPARVHQEPWNEPDLGRALRALAQHAVRFTPLVMPDHDGLMLDCTGCTHLFGGVRATAARIARCFVRAGFASRVGIAPCPGAAWAAARYAPEDLSIIEPHALEQSLAPLPIEALRLTPADAGELRTVGVATIADLLKLPRAALAERFGPGVLRRLDQAFGREIEILRPVRSRPPLRLFRVFDGPTDRPEAIALCVRNLLKTLAARLTGREAGCREIAILLRRSDLPPVHIVARASRPSRDADHWSTLLGPQLELAHLGFGVESVELHARGVVVLAHRQQARWLDAHDRSNADDLARLADTLRSRLGDRSVLQMRPRASHIPERSWSAEAPSMLEVGTATQAAPQLDRPTLLLAHPVPIESVCLFPDGPIGSVRMNGEARRVVRCRGPERLCGEWWRQESGGRDYYQIQAEDGAWLWVFRSSQSGRWFLHGEWA